MATMPISNNKWQLAFDASVAATGTSTTGAVITKTLPTAGKFVDKDIEIKITPKATATQGILTVTPSIVSDNITSGSASMAPTGFTASSTATDYYVTLSTSAGSVKPTADATVSTAGYVTTAQNKTTTASSVTSVNVSGNRTKLYIPKAAVTLSGSVAATAPTISRTTTGTNNVSNGEATTSVPSSGYYVTATATAPATTITPTKTVGTAGYLAAASQIIGTVSTTAKTGSTYYIPVVSNTITGSVVDLSVPSVAVSGTATGFTASSTATDYYVTISGSGTDGSVKGKATAGSTTGVIAAGATNTSAASIITPTITGSGVKVYIPVASMTFAGGALNNKGATATINSNITTASTDEYTNGLSIQAVGKAGRAAVTYTNTAGYLAEHNSATNVSAAVSQTSWSGTSYYLKGVTLTKPSSGERKFDITVPNGTGTVTFHFHVDSSGNVYVD